MKRRKHRKYTWNVIKYSRLAGSIGAQSCQTSPPGGPKAGKITTSKPGLKVVCVKVDCTIRALPVNSDVNKAADG